MHRKFLPLTLVLVILLTLLAMIGFRALGEAAPAISLAEEKKEVYLTFDDGPSTRVTGRILDVCKEEGVKATFFIVGDRVAGREEVLARIAAEGHTLGVHSMTHRYREIYSSAEAFEKDFEACAALIEKTAGVVPHVYRFPGGGPKDRSRYLSLLKEKGYRAVGWNAVCGDEEIASASAETLFERTVETSRGKNSVVLLLHDSAPHIPTAEALPTIIDYFRRQGYVFCTF